MNAHYIKPFIICLFYESKGFKCFSSKIFGKQKKFPKPLVYQQGLSSTREEVGSITITGW